MPPTCGAAAGCGVGGVGVSGAKPGPEHERTGFSYSQAFGLLKTPTAHAWLRSRAAPVSVGQMPDKYWRDSDTLCLPHNRNAT